MRVGALVLLVVCTLLPARGETIYAAAVTGDILAIDPQQGISSVLVHTGVCWYDIALAGDGTLYGSDGSSLYRLDLLDGTATLLGSFGAFVNGMTFVGETLYASGLTELYTVNVGTGHAQLVGSTGFVSAGDLQWFQDALYLTATAAPSDRLVRLDPVTGSGTLVGDIGFLQVYGLGVSGSRMYGVTATGDLLEIDPTSGAGVRVGSAGGRVYGATSAAAPQSIPEPSAVLLLGSGLTVLGMRLRHS